MACNKVQPVVRKAKKKQAKDELDRIKQAEKKKRRLEKALATSAAIRSELEKKKQKKKEEQQRLDEEGAAIAEAVALHVLGEDSDDSCKLVLNQKGGFNPWDCDGNLDLFTSGRRVSLPHHNPPKCTLEEIGVKGASTGPVASEVRSSSTGCHYKVRAQCRLKNIQAVKFNQFEGNYTCKTRQTD